MKKVYFMLLGVLLSTAVMADNEQTVTIGGSQVGKTVKEITFDGDNVNLTFDDETTKTQDMSLGELACADITTGISNIETSNKVLAGKVVNLNGQLVVTSTQNLNKVIYIVNVKLSEHHLCKRLRSFFDENVSVLYYFVLILQQKLKTTIY